MNFDDSILLKIEDYLDGKLQGQELLDFENQLHQNPELASYVEKSVLADQLLLDLKGLELKEIVQKEHLQSKKNKKLLRVAIWLAAGLLLLSVVWFALGKKQNSTLPKSKAEVEHSEDNKEIPSPATELAKTESQKHSPKTISEKTEENESNDLEEIQSPKVINEPTLVKQEEQILPEKSPSEKVNEKVEENSCDRNPVKVSLSTKASCAHQSNGSVFLSEISGGQKPFKMFIVDEEGNRSSNNLTLASGAYVAEITDARSCSIQQKFTIGEKRCGIDYSFSPSRGEAWEIPDADLDGYLTITDASGKVVFQQPIKAEQHLQWNGTTSFGDLPAGYYPFHIVYSDKSVISGSITLVP